MANHPNGRKAQSRATKVTERRDIPLLVARIARLWAELHEFDREMALEVARSLPRMEIMRS